jgi:hypothetical protein
MTPAGLLAELAALGVTMTRAGEKLIVDAPKGVLTPTMRSRLIEAKAALLDTLAEEIIASEVVAPPVLLPEEQRPDHDQREIERTAGDTSSVASAPGKVGRTAPSLPPDCPTSTVRKRGFETCWGRERGWIAIRDPSDGVWHEVQARDAPLSWRPRRSVIR